MINQPQTINWKTRKETGKRIQSRCMRPGKSKKKEERGTPGYVEQASARIFSWPATRQIEIDSKLACGLTAIAGDDDDPEWRSGPATKDEGRITAGKWERGDGEREIVR